MSRKEMTTWRKELTEEFKFTGDSFDDLYIDITEKELDEEFYPGFGISTAPVFQAWGKNYVYMSHEYDGSDSIIAMPRNPSPGSEGVWRYEKGE